MKIKITENHSREIELPHYVRSKKYPDTYIMTVGDKAAVKVQDRLLDIEFEIFPKIEIVAPYSLTMYVMDGFFPISEAEFKNAYIRVSLLLEKLLN